MRGCLQVLWRASERVCVSSQGVVTAATSLITTLAQKNPEEFKTSVSLAVSRLSRVSLLTGWSSGWACSLSRHFADASLSVGKASGQPAIRGWTCVLVSDWRAFLWPRSGVACGRRKRAGQSPAPAARCAAPPADEGSRPVSLCDRLALIIRVVKSWSRFSC